MINIHNISNLEMFDQEGSSVPCSNDLQEAIQAGIAKKVGKLLNTEGFLALIPNFNPNEDTKLRIYLTKDGITIQLIERDTNTLKTDKSYSEDNQLVTPEIKIRKEKIIKKVDSLFKESSALDPSSRLQSEKIRPLFIPSQSNKEQVPSKIHFDATLSNPQTHQLHARIEDLQNKKTLYPKELQVINDQLELLRQAIHNLSAKQENITYPHTEEYALINKLVDNQRDICQKLLDLLSRNLNQAPITPHAQEIKNSTLKEMLLKLQKEKTDLEQTINLIQQSYKEVSQTLEHKEKEIVALQEKLKTLSSLESERTKLLEQLNQARENQTQLTANYNNQAEQLEKSNKALQTQLSAKDLQIASLDEQIQIVNSSHQKLEDQHSLLLQKLDTLKQSSSLIEKDHKETSQLLEGKTQEILTLQEKLKELSNLKQEKINLESEQAKLIEQLNQVRQNANQEVDKLKNLLFQSEKDKESLNKELTGLNYIFSELGNDLVTHGLAEENFYKVIEEAIDRIETISQENPLELDTPQISIENLKQTITELQQKLEDANDENEQLISNVQRKERTIEKLEKEIITFKTSLSQLGMERLEELTKQIDVLTTLNIALEERLNEKISSEKDLKKKLEQTIFELEQEKKFRQSFEEELDKELEESQKNIQLAQKKFINQEKSYKDLIESLENKHAEQTKRRTEIISTLIKDLEQKQRGSCIFLLETLARWVNSGSITKEEKENILSLIEPAFKSTDEYKNFSSSGSDSSDEESKDQSLDGYEEDNIFSNETLYQNY